MPPIDGMFEGGAARLLKMPLMDGMFDPAEARSRPPAMRAIRR